MSNSSPGPTGALEPPLAGAMNEGETWDGNNSGKLYENDNDRNTPGYIFK